MKRAIACSFVMAMLMGLSALAMDGAAVEYVNGTAAGVKEGSTGTVDTTAAKALEFHAGGAGFSIPYDGVQVYKYCEENRFRLGVLPAVAVGILKARSKRHIVTIGWKDANGVAQVVKLETSKDDALGLIAVLRARSTHACEGRAGQQCAFGE